MRVLICDDSPAIVAQLRSICLSLFEAPEILVAEDLAAARARLGHRPDVIFIDIRLANGANGLDLLWDIGRSLPEARIVTISGLPRSDPVVTAGRSVGVHAHIEKPLRIEDVRQALGPDIIERTK